MTRTKQTLIPLLMCITLLPLLFLGGPEYYRFRLLPYIWDLGHVVLFWALTTLVLFRFKSMAKKLGAWFVPLMLLLLVLISIPIELLQGGQGREASAMDIVRNVVGGLLAIAFHPLKPIHYRIQLLSLRALSLALVLVVASPLLVHSVDLFNAYRQFPVIADFESGLEQLRWEGHEINIVNDPEDENNHYLKAGYTTDQYSNLTINTLSNDWSGYSSLVFKVLNPSDDYVQLVIRLHDNEHHRSGWAFDDRFNRRLSVKPGWNDFTIKVSDIEQSPTGRRMNLSRLEKLTLFTIRLDRERVLYVDDIKLLP